MIKISQLEEGYKAGTVSKATMIKMALFRNELEKTAAGQSFMSSFGRAAANQLPMMMAGAGMLGVGTAIHEGIKALENKYQDYKLSQEKIPAYEAMLRQHPDLTEQPELAKVYFDALWHYSPIMAQEPLSAGAYIKNALNMHHVAQGPLPSVVKEIVDIGKAHHQMNEHKDSDGTLGNIFMGIKTGPGPYDFSKGNTRSSRIKKALNKG